MFSGPMVFLGLMGCGKTTVGEVVARELGRSFDDSDRSLLGRWGASGGRIAEERGIEALHEFEAEHLLEALSSRAPIVVSAAASVADRADCVEMVRSDALGVWLDIEPRVLVERLRTPGHRRSLPGGEAALENQRQVRQSGFRSAAALVLTDGSLESMVARAIEFVEEYPENGFESGFGRRPSE